ncbi:beta-1,3-glucan-binding protein [Aspergillus lentulus]|uniref:Beta-1,3-glucan-binding protein n=1 Tax=Aspergillus lentulus TaxID=293939 RepID=A0ABQ0ZV40_ASPLE|nr:beta-1,3-glucan-binding protein [Aspergillus lentulus]
MPAYRYPSRLALLHRVPGNVIRDSQRARLGRVGVAAQTLPDRHNDIQTERAEAATNLQSIRRTSNVTLRRGDRGRVVHYRRAAEALRSELHACVGEAGLGAGGLVGLHRVAGDENGGFQGAVVGVVRVAAEGAPAEGRVDAAEIAQGLHIVPTLTLEDTDITPPQLVDGYMLNLTTDGSCTTTDQRLSNQPPSPSAQSAAT